MSEDEKSIDNATKESALNKQMSPFASGALFGAIAFAVIFYRSYDFLRALLVGGVVFAGLFWVVWAGRYLESRGKKKAEK